jgi:hypothetical protein
MTTITITDPVLLKQLAEAQGPVLFRDPAGNVIHASAGPIGSPPPGYVPPISVAELQRRSATYHSGIPLSEALKRIKGQE